MAIEIQNKKTKRTYFIDKNQWDAIVSNGREKKYIYVGETKDIQQKLTPPKEVIEIVKKKKNDR